MPAEGCAVVEVVVQDGSRERSFGEAAFSLLIARCGLPTSPRQSCRTRRVASSSAAPSALLTPPMAACGGSLASGPHPRRAAPRLAVAVLPAEARPRPAQTPPRSPLFTPPCTSASSRSRWAAT